MTKPLARIRAGWSQDADAIIEVVPAAPGFYALDVVHDENGKASEFTRTPVAAWGITDHGSALPLLPYCESSVIDAAILAPDGGVSSYDGHWATAAEWFETVLAWANKTP
jgi:hypothetical protein